MATRVRIFIDYWNFQLNWNERSNEARCDWLALPWSLLKAAERVTRCPDLSYEGTHIYASVDSQNDNLLNWLETFLERQAGFSVTAARTVRRPRVTRCSGCGGELDTCPDCGEALSVATAKGLTTRMVCDLMRLCERGACDLPVLVTSDTELVPAIECLVGDGVKVMHAGWRETGLDLTRVAWGSIDLDPLVSGLVRTS